MAEILVRVGDIRSSGREALRALVQQERLSHGKGVKTPPTQHARFYAGTGAGRSDATGLNVMAIMKAPIPMIQEPM